MARPEGFEPPTTWFEANQAHLPSIFIKFLRRLTRSFPVPDGEKCPYLTQTGAILVTTFSIPNHLAQHRVVVIQLIIDLELLQIS